MTPNGPRKQDDALALAIASGKTLRDAAAAVGVSERTAKRRWADPAFKQRVTELRTEAVSRASGKMGDTMAEAADVLRKLLKSRKEGVRLGACRAVLEFGMRLHDETERDARLQALEEDAAKRAAEEGVSKK